MEVLLEVLVVTALRTWSQTGEVWWQHVQGGAPSPHSDSGGLWYLGVTLRAEQGLTGLVLCSNKLTLMPENTESRVGLAEVRLTTRNFFSKPYAWLCHSSDATAVDWHMSYTFIFSTVSVPCHIPKLRNHFDYQQLAPSPAWSFESL